MLPTLDLSLWAAKLLTNSFQIRQRLKLLTIGEKIRQIILLSDFSNHAGANFTN